MRRPVAPTPAPKTQVAKTSTPKPRPGKVSKSRSVTFEAPETKEASAADVRRATKQRRRALRGEIRRFTKDSRRRRRIRIGVVGAVLALVAGTLFVAYGPVFSVRQITVLGANQMDPGDIEAALSSQRGVPLARVDDKAVKASLSKFALIESYWLEARPPHELIVRIVERTPIGVIETANGYSLVDAAGVVLESYEQRPPGRALLITTGDSSDAAFVALAQALRSLPEELLGNIDRATAANTYDISFVLTSGVNVFWGSAEDSTLKALVLTQTIAKLPQAQSIDVSAPEAVVIT